MTSSPASRYCGRLAPTPTGGLHLGHARTFRVAWARAREAGGEMILRIEDLDTGRCKPEFVAESIEDLAWLGLDWDGEPVRQSALRDRYVEAWRRLKEEGHIYPCTRSRRELRELGPTPKGDEQDAEPIYPAAWRPPPGAEREYDAPAGANWRFRVPVGERVSFTDARKGEVSFVAGEDFGDFKVWRRDDVPAYELSVVVDDIAMGITEVVRGEDLLRSTARQILLYRALGATPPAWCHEPLVRDASGRRLAKRFQSLSLRTLREQGRTAEEVLGEVFGKERF